MSKRDVRLFLSDILEAITKVERYTAGLSFEEFQANDMVIDAVTRNLEVIGEAVKRIPHELRVKYPQQLFYVFPFSPSERLNLS